MSNKLKSMQKKVKSQDRRNFIYVDDFMAELEEKIADRFYQCGLTNRAMFYQCEICGHKILIWLERGLEEHNGDMHKPVPFSAICPKCGDVHMYHVDWENDIHISRDIRIPNHSYYFSNIKSMECGTLKYKE